MNLGTLIRKYRKERKLTLKNVAEKVSISEGFLSQVENDVNSREHAKPGEAVLRSGDSVHSIHKVHEISSFAQLISLCCDVGKKCSPSDAGNLTNLGCGLV